jgi:hypothetical protein
MIGPFGSKTSDPPAEDPSNFSPAGFALAAKAVEGLGERAVQAPTPGRILLVNIGPDPREHAGDRWRPAIVIAVRADGDVFSGVAEVFLAPGDVPFSHTSGMFLEREHAYIYVNDRSHGEAVGGWIWPPRG